MARDPIYDDMKQMSQEKFNKDRQTFMDKALENDDGGWVKHTKWHWSRFVDGDKLDYWPSRNKFQFRNKVQRGDVYAFIKEVANG